MNANLSNGALAKIFDGQDVTDPILQVLGHKLIDGGGQERWGSRRHLFWAMGGYSSFFCLGGVIFGDFEEK